ncbi:MAG: TetR/AcrR family transcriptional regulator [Bacillales bacterium]|nr:TetR/AcrR family transcriptional regulator [Bacillales bacterium]
MPPKFKFKKEQIIDAAVRVTRVRGIDQVRAVDIAKELGVSTQPVFTCFSTMNEAKREIRLAAEKIFDSYVNEGLKERIPFLGFGKAYIRFVHDEPELYKALFLSKKDEEYQGSIVLIEKTKNRLIPILMNNYYINYEEAEYYFNSIWLTVCGIAALCINNCNPYDDEELAKLFTNYSISTYKSIKEIPGFIDFNYNKETIFSSIKDGMK